jgi:hypothetical protein
MKATKKTDAPKTAPTFFPGDLIWEMYWLSDQVSAPSQIHSYTAVNSCMLSIAV